MLARGSGWRRSIRHSYIHEATPRPFARKKGLRRLENDCCRIYRCAPFIKVFGNAGVLPFLHFANGISGAGGGLLVEFTNVIDHLAVVRQFARRPKGDVGAKLGDIANCGYYRVDVG